MKVYFLPGNASGDELDGATVAVIDVLRASTVVVVALAAGGERIVVCGRVEEARDEANRLPASNRLLGGERGGERIDGFDLGNSPREYSRNVVQGKTIVFTTTNGAQALLQCSAAARVIVAGLTNLSVVAASLAESPNVALLCSGTGGEISREDVLAAGAIVERAIQFSAKVQPENDQARLALDAWHSIGSGVDGARLLAALADSQGGRNLARIGMDSDVADAAAIDRYSILPEYDPRTRSIVAAPCGDQPGS
jgi:2-phosphosulfolactate phosphatase